MTKIEEIQKLYDAGASMSRVFREIGVPLSVQRRLMVNGETKPSEKLAHKMGIAKEGAEKSDAWANRRELRIKQLQDYHDQTGRSFQTAAKDLHISRDFAAKLVRDGILVVRSRGTKPQQKRPAPIRMIGFKAQTVEDFLDAGGKITRLPSVLAVDCPQARVPQSDLDAMKAIYAEREKQEKAERGKSGWKLKKIMAQRALIAAQVAKMQRL